MKKIKYNVLTPINITVDYWNTPEFYDDNMCFNYLIREPGKFLKVSLDDAKVYIKELKTTFRTDENGVINHSLKDGLYHAKIVDFGKTDIFKQYEVPFVEEDSALKEESKQNLLKQQRYHKFVVNKNRYYYGNGSRRVKIREEDIPEYYIEGYDFHTHGVYTKAKDVKDIVYVRSKVAPESFKYDMLYISYDKPLKEVVDKHGFVDYDNADVILSGLYILDFVDGLIKYSPDCNNLARVILELKESEKRHKELRNS